MKQLTLEYSNIRAQVTTFDETSGVSEHHVVMHVTNPRLTFQQQLDALLDAYNDLITKTLTGAVAVIKRYFLSDASNQADQVIASDSSDCAKSIIQQAPLNGTKIGLWAYLMKGVVTSVRPNGLYEVCHGCYRHLWNASAHNLAANSEYQTRLLFNEYVMQLTEEGCTLADNCLRTWLFVNDIDLNYGGVVRARNQVFFTQGLTHDTHFIASTGIGGRQQDPNVLCQMDNYAVDGLRKEQIRYLYAQTHLNRTSDYGVSFERGTRIDYGDRCHVLISGTASINNKGLILHEGDVVSQTRRMWENVEALLNEAECTFDDATHFIVYLRDMADYAIVSGLFQERFPQKPWIIVQAPVCRQGWLVEMECMAVKQQLCPDFPAL
ncbi:MAG: hypothetical protein IJV45_11455 [Prevotella sp.]|nr:hypothetical protein [Prevotella sp.]